MKIAVTGSNGDVGRRVVVAALKAGHSVLAIDLAPEAVLAKDVPQNIAGFAYLSADLKDSSLTLEALKGCDAIVHLAAHRSPGDYRFKSHNDNVVISWNVLRSAAELGITRIALASSVNVYACVFSKTPRLHYLPIDEEHPTEPDEPYGLSKLILEQQADAIVRRFPSTRIASFRLHWSVPNAAYDVFKTQDPERSKNDLWGWIQEDSGAEAFLSAVVKDDLAWHGHERFVLAAPTLRVERSAAEMWRTYWSHIPLKDEFQAENLTSFFDCRKAERLLGWTHPDVRRDSGR